MRITKLNIFKHTTYILLRTFFASKLFCSCNALSCHARHTQTMFYHYCYRSMDLYMHVFACIYRMKWKSHTILLLLHSPVWFWSSNKSNENSKQECVALGKGCVVLILHIKCLLAQAYLLLELRNRFVHNLVLYVMKIILQLVSLFL